MISMIFLILTILSIILFIVSCNKNKWSWARVYSLLFMLLFWCFIISLFVKVVRQWL